MYRQSRRLLVAIVSAMLSMPASAIGQDATSSGDPRAEIDAVLVAAAPAKLLVAERFVATREWAVDAATIGFEAPADIPGTIEIDHGTIAVSFTGPAANGNMLWLVPNDAGSGTVTWTCETTLPAELKPEGCR